MIKIVQNADKKCGNFFRKLERGEIAENAKNKMCVKIALKKIADLNFEIKNAVRSARWQSCKMRLFSSDFQILCPLQKTKILFFLV